MLTSSAYCVVLLTQWRTRRDDDHWLYWAVSAGLYPVILLAFDASPHAAVVALLYGALIFTNVLILAGIRRFDGRDAWRPWMVGVILATIAAVLAPGIWGETGASIGWSSRIGGTAGLAVSMVLVGGIIVFERHRTAVRGRRIVGLAMLGYIPAYIVAILADASGGFDANLAVLLPMLSDQLLLGILYLGLLSMSGERAHATLRDLALRDPLTGALNRAGLTSWCADELAPDTGLILVDVDHFKTINDRHGHAAGDGVLVDLVRRATACLSDGSDCIARLGGDEFVILKARTTLAEVRALADRLRQAGVPVSNESTGLPDWTASFGVAMSAGSLADTLARADRALYLAKASGRAMVVS